MGSWLAGRLAVLQEVWEIKRRPCSDGGHLCLQDMELEDAVHTALLTLKEGFEGQISGQNIEVAIVGDDQKFRVLTAAEVSDYLEEVE